VEILGVESSQVRERFIVEGGATSQGVVEGDQLRFMARSISSTASVVELAPYAPALHKRVALVPTGYPAVPGASWKVGNASYTEDSVTVPAGTFAALRVEITGTAEAFGLATTTYAQPARFVYTAWYAPEIKRYVKVRHQTWSRVGTSVGDEIVQLTAYQPRK